MRVKTESGKVVSSHSSAWGASSFVTNARIDSRSWSCSSVKMKCLRRIRRRGHRCGARGEVCAAASARGAGGGDRRVSPDRRRVLVLRLHAVEGDAPARRATDRGAAHPGRARGRDGRPRRRRRAQAARRDHPRPRRLEPGALAREARGRGLPRAWPPRRRAARARRRRHAYRAKAGGRHGGPAADAADRRPGARRSRTTATPPRRRGPAGSSSSAVESWEWEMAQATPRSDPR